MSLQSLWWRSSGRFLWRTHRRTWLHRMSAQRQGRWKALWTSHSLRPGDLQAELFASSFAVPLKAQERNSKDHLQSKNKIKHTSDYFYINGWHKSTLPSQHWCSLSSVTHETKVHQLLSLSVKTAEEWLTTTSCNQILYNTDLMLCAHVFVYVGMNASVKTPIRI